MKQLSFILLTVAFLTPKTISAQCPVITCPSTLALPCSTTGAGVLITATSNYSANISSRWLSPQGFELVSYGTASSITFLNYAGTYTVEFTDNSSNCVVTQTVSAVNTSTGVPTFSLSSSSSFTSNCTIPTTLNIVNPQAQGGGATSYHFGPISSLSSFTPNPTYTVPSCGHYYAKVKQVATGCISSYSVNVKCIPGPAPVITITPNPLCLGQVTMLNASGLLTYSWSTGSNFPIIPVSPTEPTIYIVGGNNIQGCGTSALIQAIDCSQPVGIGWLVINDQRFNVFPNPVTDHLSIQANEDNVQFTIFDISGRRMMEGVLNQIVELDLSAFRAGIYLLRFESGKQAFYKRIVIE